MVDSINSSPPAAVSPSPPVQRSRTEDPSALDDESVRPPPGGAEPESARALYGGLRREAASGGEPVNLETVQRIKDLIAEGRYPIDLARVARKMVELDLGIAYTSTSLAERD